ncbi:DUF5605 domain-containing protein [Paenibacillus illinoisensis]|uniref:DUF5605 domain-containing protein n=1 Tax=Paenibacillus illinoisensis TaxID=59845 RepID=UPI001C8E1AB5|nr:DUF5605 domain-containing protein [Paenibacillus illinoisensis]MBY0219839.1 DUF5605 domain-containing protein [Paenibacillus illinoisensis]
MENAMLNETVAEWSRFELRLPGSAEGNPYVDTEWTVVFRLGDQEYKVSGFYAGSGEHVARFMPPETGKWTYETFSQRPELNHVQGSFTCVSAAHEVHGSVRIRDVDRFAYADGTPYYPFGTTAYAWIYQTETLRSATLQTLAEGPFNKIRMCLFPKNYSFNTQEPELFPFLGSAEKGFDKTRFNPAFWEHAERCIESLLELQIEADIILFHPYDKGRWGFDRMSAEEDERYLRYAIARLGAYRNVWWSMANEYDFMKEKTLQDWDRLVSLVATEDPYHHLLSIHNGTAMYVPESIVMYDHIRPEITHCSIQHWDVTLVSLWRTQYGKPVIVDECGYEGNLQQRWGNLSAEEMTHRIWESFARGGYASHGETYLHPEDDIWWAKGGTLYGRSHEHIRFLRSIAEQMPSGTRPIPIRDVPVMGVEGEYYLHYYGQHQPGYREVELPEDREFEAQWIDTQGMSITRLPETYSGMSRIPLPSRPYFALRIRATEQ